MILHPQSLTAQAVNSAIKRVILLLYVKNLQEIDYYLGNKPLAVSLPDLIDLVSRKQDEG